MHLFRRWFGVGSSVAEWLPAIWGMVLPKRLSADVLAFKLIWLFGLKNCMIVDCLESFFVFFGVFLPKRKFYSTTQYMQLLPLPLTKQEYKYAALSAPCISLSLS